MRAMTGGDSWRSRSSSACGVRPSFSIATSQVGSSTPGALPPPIADDAAHDLGAPATDLAVIAAASASARVADLVGAHRQHALHRDGRVRASGRVLRQRRLERGVGHLVDAQRAHQRVRADAVDDRRAPDDDAGLRSAEQLVAAEAADVDAGRDRGLHRRLVARTHVPGSDGVSETCGV